MIGRKGSKTAKKRIRPSDVGIKPADEVLFRLDPLILQIEWVRLDCLVSLVLSISGFPQWERIIHIEK